MLNPVQAFQVFQRRPTCRCPAEKRQGQASEGVRPVMPHYPAYTPPQKKDNSQKLESRSFLFRVMHSREMSALSALLKITRGDKWRRLIKRPHPHRDCRGDDAGREDGA